MVCVAVNEVEGSQRGFLFYTSGLPAFLFNSHFLASFFLSAISLVHPHSFVAALASAAADSSRQQQQQTTAAADSSFYCCLSHTHSVCRESSSAMSHYSPPPAPSVPSSKNSSAFSVTDILCAAAAAAAAASAAPSALPLDDCIGSYRNAKDPSAVTAPFLLAQNGYSAQSYSAGTPGISTLQGGSVVPGMSPVALGSAPGGPGNPGLTDQCANYLTSPYHAGAAAFSPSQYYAATGSELSHHYAAAAAAAVAGGEQGILQQMHGGRAMACNSGWYPNQEQQRIQRKYT